MGILKQVERIQDMTVDMAMTMGLLTEQEAVRIEKEAEVDFLKDSLEPSDKEKARFHNWMENEIKKCSECKQDISDLEVDDDTCENCAGIRPLGNNGEE